MRPIASVNLKVVVIDTDYYALQAINSYLAWDRRTRVIFSADNYPALWRYLEHIAPAEYPDVAVLDADHVGGLQALQNLLKRLARYNPDLLAVCLAQFADPELTLAAAQAGARAFLLKQEVRLQIAWAIVYALDHPFLMTAQLAHACAHLPSQTIRDAAILPEQRHYPEMTDRIRQAIKLCVIEGMPAQLAADEMGISLHTVRGYIKEGYRILEAYDETEYPTEMTPQERAFMRFTALANDR